MSIGWPVNTLGDANWWFWIVFPSTSHSCYSFIRAFLFPVCTCVHVPLTMVAWIFCVLRIQCITMIAILFNIQMVPTLATVSPFEWTAVFLWHDPIVCENFPAQRWRPSWLWTFPASEWTWLLYWRPVFIRQDLETLHSPSTLIIASQPIWISLGLFNSCIVLHMEVP